MSTNNPQLPIDPNDGFSRAGITQRNSALRSSYNTLGYEPHLSKRTYDLSLILSILYHRKWTVLFTTLLFSLLALLISFLIKPAFKANAIIEISRYSFDAISFDDLPTSNLDDDKEFYKTQYGLLRSPRLAKHVIDTLGLTEFQLTGEESEDENQENSKEENQGVKNLEEVFLSKLFITPTKGSRLVTVSFESHDPHLSALIANTFVDEFIQYNIGKKRGTSSFTRDFLTSRVREIQEKLETAEYQLDDYASKNKIIKYDENETVKLVALQKMQEMLAVAEKENIDANGIRLQSKGNGANVSVMNNSVIQALKQQKIKLQADYQEMLQTFKPTYPLMSELQKRIKKIDQEISYERNNILRNNIDFTNTNFDASNKKVNRLRNKVSLLKNELMQIQSKSLDYNKIKREVSSYQTLYATLLKRLNEVTVAGNAAVNNISIVNYANTPRKKIRPRRFFNAVIGTLLGFILGTLLAFYRELSHGRIRNESEIEQVADLPILGRIPKIKPQPGKDTSLLLYSKSTSSLVEAVRSLRTNLIHAVGQNPPKTILLTSPTEGEGKTTTAINLACAYVLMGKRVLLIDADLRKPTVSKRIFKKPSKVGLSNFLAGQVKPKEIIRKSHISNLFVISSGRLPSNPVELLASEKMEELIKFGQEKFDFIIIDSAPIRNLSDSIILSRFVDATLLTVQVNKTLINDMSHALNSLENVQGNLLGIVATHTKQKHTHYSQTSKNKMLVAAN